MNDLDTLLEGIGQSKPKTKRTSYPQFPDADGTAMMLAQTSINLSEAKDQLETNNRMLGDLIRPFFFQYYAGKTEVESSLRVDAGEGRAVLVTLKNQVKKMESLEAIAPVKDIINGRAGELFSSSFEIKITGEAIPTPATAPLIAELKQIFARHGASNALSVKRDFRPTPAFFTSRHRLFTPEQNIQIDAVVPIITSVKVKGVQ